MEFMQIYDELKARGLLARKFNTPNVHKRPLGFIFLCK